MEDKYEELIHSLCVRFGWCGAATANGGFTCVDDLIPRQGQLTANQFARFVILADGEDPDGELSQSRGWMKQISDEFTKCFGTDCVDVRDLDLS